MSSASPAAAAPSAVPASAPSSSFPPEGGGSESGPNEEDLRRTVRSCLHRLTRREPLDPTYKNLLLSPALSSRTPTIPKDRLYKKVPADLRERVESYVASGMDQPGGSHGRKRGRARDDLEDGPMRAAFTLREPKKHEQEALVSASLAASIAGRSTVRPDLDEASRRKRLELTAVALQDREKRQRAKSERAKVAVARARAAARDAAERDRERGGSSSSASKVAGGGGGAAGGGGASSSSRDPRDAASEMIAERDRLRLEAEALRKAEADLRREEERERATEERNLERSRRERERQREAARKKREEDERKRSEERKEEERRRERMSETPQQALHRLYHPVFKVLWDMEFARLHGTNPFRIVIDKENCAAMGVPDYCDVIKTPMNLTYIQEKVDGKEYRTLKDFFADVELMLSNALLYNSDPNNEFHLAAKEMKRKYKKMYKKVVQSLQQQSQKQQAG